MSTPESDLTPSAFVDRSQQETIDPFMAELFFSESTEILQALERDLLALEGELPGGVAKQFRQLLRSAHSLKGSAWMFELGEVAQAAHQLEDSLTRCQSCWTLIGDQTRRGWLSQWLQVVDGLVQMLKMSRSESSAPHQQATQDLQQALEDLPQGMTTLASEQTRSGQPSLQETILSTELPPLLETLVAISGAATDLESIRLAIPDLLEHLQTLTGVAQMLKLKDLLRPIEEMETLTAQALITNEQLEDLPQLWMEHLIAIEGARLAALTSVLEGQSLELHWRGTADPERSQPDQQEIFKVGEGTPNSTHDLEDNPEAGPGDPDGVYRGELGLISKVDTRRVNTVVNLVEELVIQKTALDHQRQELSRLTRGAKRILKGMRQSRQRLRRSTDQLDIENAPDVQRETEDLDGLEWDRYSQLHEAAYDLLEQSALLQEAIEDLAQLERRLDQIGDQFSRLCGDLSEQSSRLQLAPFSQAVDHLPRAIRELSQAYGKPVDLVLYGRNVELDAQVLRQLRDPLTHLVRNAFDHGIETPEHRVAAGKSTTGQIEIEARHQGSYTVITVRDDGRGIDGDRIRRRMVQLGYCNGQRAQEMSETELFRFLFKPGFSTRTQVSEISGRGVGLDIVEAVITQMQGQINVQSQPGQGTIFTLRLPLVLSLVPALVVRADRDVVAIPQEQILQILRVPLEVATGTTLTWEDQTLPLVKLPEFLQYHVAPSETPWQTPLTVEKFRLPVLILQNLQGEVIAGLAVDQLLGHQEIVLKPLPSLLPKPLGVRGVAVFGTGQVMMVLDTEELLQTRSDLSRSTLPLQAPDAPTPIPASDPQQSKSPGVLSKGRILVVDDSYSVRQMLAMTLERQGYQVDQAQDGQAALTQLAVDPDYQVIITDLEMPRLDGFGLLHHLLDHPQLSQIPAIVLTSRSGEKYRARAQSLQAAAYLTKPFRRQDLLQVLELLIVSNPLDPEESLEQVLESL